MQRLLGIFCGRIDDGGFIESGYLGASQACQRFGLAFDYVCQTDISAEALSAAIDAAAIDSPDLMVVHGGRSDEAVAIAAPRYPVSSLPSRCRGPRTWIQLRPWPRRLPLLAPLDRRTPRLLDLRRCGLVALSAVEGLVMAERAAHDIRLVQRRFYGISDQ